MSVQITDCTIRDGGYLFNKNPDKEFVKGIMKGLALAGIDFVETGFLQDNVSGENLVYKNSNDARKYLPEDKGQTTLIILMASLLSGLGFLLQNMKQRSH